MELAIGDAAFMHPATGSHPGVLIWPDAFGLRPSMREMAKPDAKTKLKEAFAAAKVPTEIEVYPQSQHGWCVPDMPKQANGQPIYNKPDADRAWGKLLALYKAGLI